MAYDIHPLSFGEILDRAFRVYLDNFVLLFGISAVVWLPSGLILASAELIGSTAAAVLNALFLMVAGVVFNAALNFGVASVYLDRPTTIVEAYRSSFAIIVPMIGTYLLIAVLFVIPGIVVGGFFAASRSGTWHISGAVFAVALVAFILIGGYFIVSWMLATPIMVIERHFGMTALRRSRELVIGSWWLTLAIAVVAGLIVQIPATALKFVWGFIPVFGVVLTALTQAVTSAYSVIAIIIYYFDRRCRTEDFDLRLLAEHVRAQSPSAMTPARGPSLA